MKPWEEDWTGYEAAPRPADPVAMPELDDAGVPPWEEDWTGYSPAPAASTEPEFAEQGVPEQMPELDDGDQGFLESTAKTFGIGSVELAQAVVELGDYLTEWSPVDTGVADSARDLLGGWREGIYDSLDDETKEALEKQWLTTEDAVWQDPYSFAMGLVRTAPSLVIPGGAAAKAGKVGFGKALTKGATEQAAKKAAEKAATVAGTAAGAGLGGGYAGTEVREDIEAMSYEELSMLPEFRELAAETGDLHAAREALITKAQHIAVPLAGGVSGATGAWAGHVLGQQVGRGAGRGVVTAAPREAGIEGAQEGVEQAAVNIAARENYDPDRGYGEGVGEAMAGGAAFGGVVGGATGGYAGWRNKRDLADLQTGGATDDSTAAAVDASVNDAAGRPVDSDDLSDVAAAVNAGGQGENARVDEVFEEGQAEQPRPGDSGLGDGGTQGPAGAAQQPGGTPGSQGAPESDIPGGTAEAAGAAEEGDQVADEFRSITDSFVAGSMAADAWEQAAEATGKVVSPTARERMLNTVFDADPDQILANLHQMARGTDPANPKRPVGRQRRRIAARTLATLTGNPDAAASGVMTTPQQKKWTKLEQAAATPDVRADRPALYTGFRQLAGMAARIAKQRAEAKKQEMEADITARRKEALATQRRLEAAKRNHQRDLTRERATAKAKGRKQWAELRARQQTAREAITQIDAELEKLAKVLRDLDVEHQRAQQYGFAARAEALNNMSQRLRRAATEKPGKQGGYDPSSPRRVADVARTIAAAIEAYVPDALTRLTNNPEQEIVAIYDELMKLAEVPAGKRHLLRTQMKRAQQREGRKQRSAKKATATSTAQKTQRRKTETAQRKAKRVAKEHPAPGTTTENVVADIATTTNKVGSLRRKIRLAMVKGTRMGSTPGGPRRFALPVLQKRMIREVYGKDFSGTLMKDLDGRMRNPIEVLADLYRRRDGQAKKNLRKVDQALLAWSRLPKDAKLAINELIIAATTHDVVADKPLAHDANKHLQRTQAARDAHADAFEKYQALRKRYPQAAKVYRDTRQAFINNRKKMVKLLLRTTVETAGIDAAHMPVSETGKRGLTTEEDVKSLRKWWDDYAADRTKKPPPIPDEAFLDNLEQITQMATMRGDYFPLRRRGEYVVDASHEFAEAFQTRDAALKWTAEQRYKHPHWQVDAPRRGLGGWTVGVNDRIYELYESHGDAEVRVAELEKEGTYKPKPVAYRPDYQLQDDPSAPQFLRAAARKLKDDPRAVRALGELYVQQMSQQSAKRMLLRRKRVAGYELDMLKAVADGLTVQAHHLAQLDVSPRIRQAFDALDEAVEARIDAGDKTGRVTRQQEVIRELRKQDRQDATPLGARTAQALNAYTNASFIFFLMSPSYVIMNALQNWSVGLPFLKGKHGYTESAAELVQASGDILHGGAIIPKRPDKLDKASVKSWLSKAFVDPIFRRADIRFDEETIKANKMLSPEDRKALIRLLDSGIVDQMFAENVERSAAFGTGISADTAAKKVAGTISRGGGALMNATRFPVQLVERINRGSMGLAAFRLMRQKGATMDEAVDYAKQAIIASHFDYADRPRIFKHPVGRVLTQYRLFGLNLSFLYLRAMAVGFGMTRGDSKQMRREHRRQFYALTAMNGALSGVLYGVMAEPLRALAAAIATLIEDEDDPIDIDREIVKLLDQWTGDSALTNILARGVAGTITGADVASRVGTDDLLMFGSPEGEGRDYIADLILRMSGPGVGKVADIAEAIMKDYKEGRIDRAYERVLPKSLRDFLKAQRYAEQGIRTRGNEVVVPAEDISALDRVIQMIGFQPQSVADVQLRRFLKEDFARELRGRRSDLTARWRTAKTNRDQAALSETEQEIGVFNAKYPERRITKAELFREWGKLQKRSVKRGHQGGSSLSPQEQQIYRRVMEATSDDDEQSNPD